MPEPTAHDALISLADQLTRLEGDIEEARDLGAGLALAANMARQRAEEIAAATGEAETGPCEGAKAGEPDGDLRAAEPIVITRDDLLTEWRKAHPGECSCPDGAPCDPSCPQHGDSDAPRAALLAVMGILDLDAWERWLGGYRSVRGLVGKMLAAAEPFIRAGERERCIELARDHMAWIPGAAIGPGLAEPGRWFADILREQS
jgi:hypothetical protein